MMMVIQVRLTKYAPKLGIVMNMTGIEVVTKGAFEHGRILGNDGESATKVSQTNSGDIKSIDAKALLENEIENR